MQCMKCLTVLPTGETTNSNNTQTYNNQSNCFIRPESFAYNSCSQSFWIIWFYTLGWKIAPGRLKIGSNATHTHTPHNKIANARAPKSFSPVQNGMRQTLHISNWKCLKIHWNNKQPLLWFYYKIICKNFCHGKMVNDTKALYNEHLSYVETDFKLTPTFRWSHRSEQLEQWRYDGASAVSQMPQKNISCN